MPSPRHQRLRTATRAAHQALEDTPLMRTLTHQDLDDAGYRAVITILYGFWHKHLEATHPALHRLASDLGSLGLDAAQLPVIPSQLVHPLTDPVDQLARDYLLHGSSLGGTVICRHLNTRFGEDWINAHASHFESAGQTGVKEWRAYLQRLASTKLDEAEEERLIESACALFANLRQWSLKMPISDSARAIGRLDTPA